MDRIVTYYEFYDEKLPALLFNDREFIHAVVGPLVAAAPRGGKCILCDTHTKCKITLMDLTGRQGLPKPVPPNNRIIFACFQCNNHKGDDPNKLMELLEARISEAVNHKLRIA